MCVYVCASRSELCLFCLFASVCVCVYVHHAGTGIEYVSQVDVRTRAGDLEVAVDVVSYRIPIEWRREDFAATETLHGLAGVDVFRWRADIAS